MSEQIFVVIIGLVIAVCGASLTTRCRHQRRPGKLPEDIQ